MEWRENWNWKPWTYPKNADGFPANVGFNQFLEVWGGHVQGTCYLYDIVEHRITNMVYLRSMCTAHAKFVVLDGKAKPGSPGEIKCLKHDLGLRWAQGVPKLAPVISDSSWGLRGIRSACQAAHQRQTRTRTAVEDPCRWWYEHRVYPHGGPSSLDIKGRSRVVVLPPTSWWILKV